MSIEQVELADCMQTLFRGNSLASKIMAACFKMYGQNYLKARLSPLVNEMMVEAAGGSGRRFEVDKARMEAHENLDENRENLIQLAKKFFFAIINSVNEWVRSDFFFFFFFFFAERKFLLANSTNEIEQGWWHSSFS